MLSEKRITDYGSKALEDIIREIENMSSSDFLELVRKAELIESPGKLIL